MASDPMSATSRGAHFRLLGIAFSSLVLLSCGSSEHRLGALQPPAPSSQQGEKAPSVEREGRADASLVTNDAYFRVAREMIRGAREEILLCQFLFVYGKRAIGPLQSALYDAVRRGVKVRVLLDEEAERTIQSLRYLREHGIDAKLDDPGKRTHTKLMIVDGRRALFGSTNWSEASMTINNESNLYLEDPALTEGLVRYFEFLWSNGGADCSFAPVTSKGVTLLFDRAYEPALLELLREGETISLQIYAGRYYRGDAASPSTAIIDSVRRAARADRGVRMIIEASDYEETLNGFNDEIAAICASDSVDVRRDPANVTSHAKLAISDKAVLLGSSNWGYGALRQYHELNALVTDPVLSGAVRKWYEELWTRAYPEK
jgi:phosphatidylserine/phosphatidylglycerophosphate/cardiolipin synthase-like enzyme